MPDHLFVSVAQGRKRGREVRATEAAIVSVETQATDAMAEGEVVEPLRKRLLLVLSEGEDEEEVHPTTDEVLDAEAAAAEAPDAEAITVEPVLVTSAGSPLVVTAVPSLASTTPIEPLPVILHRPIGIVLCSPPKPSLLCPQPLSHLARQSPRPLCPLHSAGMIELTAVEVSIAPPAAEEPTSSDDLAELFASLHEEGGSSASVAPLDEDSKAIIERLRDFLHMEVHQMTSAETFVEFKSCLDTAMTLGLLDSAQLDKLQVRLAEGEEMIGRYAEAGMRMTEGCSLEQELAEIKQQAQPAMAQLKENDLVVQRENKELAGVKAQIAELQARRELILERRDHVVAAGA
ncbi:uncharacterized protein Pyn_37836 [Prunus yedoensis var. nudiflora]|uniref:Uncharacterized protein n=1 Tax=Prunus yedoensis var. nudiflora TaxID=2094558 RepID=A0A314V0S4_PRUYE|nr:uncharacterized protein Pyn_37836 [Prunus yedoensis var. nudiflora]